MHRASIDFFLPRVLKAFTHFLVPVPPCIHRAAVYVGNTDLGEPRCVSLGCSQPLSPDPSCPSGSSPGSRHLEQRRRQPRGLLPAVPHHPRPAGASATSTAHAVPAQGARRPV